MRRSAAWLGLALLAACSRAPQSPVLVLVNGEPITAEALDLELRLAGPEAGSADLLMEGLVDQALILQEGHRLGVTLSQDALSAAEARARGGTDEASLSSSLAERGATLKEWRARLAQAALADAVIQQAVRNKVDIGRQEIQDYYWEHLPAFRRGKRQVLRQVYTKKRQGAEAALKELQLGARFEEVARKRGEGPEAASGGLLGPETRSQLPKALAKATEKLKPGQFSAVVSSPWGYHVLYLEAVEREQGESLDQAAPKAHARLLREKEQVLYQLWLGRLREQAKIERLVAQATPTAVKAKK